MMFNPMGSAMRSMSKSRAIPSSKARYSQIYERALQDKISQRLFDQQKQQQQQGQSDQKQQQHTPSSTSYQMTLSTLDLIEFVLREYEQTNSVMMQPVATKKQPYTIYEDLKIIYSLGREGASINTASYKRLADEGYVRRSLESIKSRYSDFLKNLTKEDYQDILSFIEINGIKGFLVFEKNEEGVRMLLRIQKNDPRSELNNASNNSGHHTPVRSPIRPLGNSSPSLFSARSPTLQQQQQQQQQAQMHPGFMPYFYPPFPMYAPPPQSSSYSSGAQPMSPYKQFFDPYAAMQMMMMNPYMAQQYPQHMMQQQQQHSRYMMHQMGDSDGGDVEFEVRPRIKHSASKAAAANAAHKQDLNNEDEKGSEGMEPRKKFKASSEENNGSQSVRRNLKSKMESENNNYLKPPSMMVHGEPSSVSAKIQTTLQFPSRNPLLTKDTELRSTGGAAPRALTKEVYDLINDEDRIAKQDFESVLDYVSETIKMRKEELVDILDALSGSFPDFAVYMETKHESMLWNSEEDKILQSINSQDSSEFKLLMKLKGLKSIKKRFAYCKIEPPFHL